MSEDVYSATLDFLRQSQYDLKLPFSLSLQVGKEEGGVPLVCRQLLRLIPGKRMVCAGIWGQREVVVKLFLDPVKATRHWQRELNGVKALEKAGIATPERLFAEVIFSGSLPIIIFARLQPAATLLNLWFSHKGSTQKQVQIRRQLLQAVVATIASHHQAGLLQSDIHWSNFLFSDEGVFTIDGDAVENLTPGVELGRGKSRANIALFLAESYPGIDQELDFIWQNYCQSRNWLFEPDDLYQLKLMIRGHRHKKADKYVAKSLRNCTAFVSSKENHYFKIKDRAYQSPALDELLLHPDHFMAQGEVLKAGNSSTVVKLDLEGVPLVVKRYNIKNLSHALRRCWRPSRAHVSWRNAQRLRWWRSATPKPVALLEKRCSGLRSTAYFISEHVAGINAFDYLQRSDLAPSDLNQWLQQFSALLQQLLELGLSHGDFKATNFICGDDGRLYLLDLDAMRYWPRSGSGFKKAVQRDHRRLLANWQEFPVLEREFQTVIEGLRIPR